jgi:hypothetical protein
MALDDEIAIADDTFPESKVKPSNPDEGPCGQLTNMCSIYSLYQKSIPHDESPDDICNYCSKNPYAQSKP